MFELNQKVTLTDITVNQKAGLPVTIQNLNLLEKLSQQNQEFVSLIHSIFYGECKACIPGIIWQYVKDNFQYMRDDPYDEVLIAPYILINTKSGDCDDFSLFIKTCLDIVGGWETRYILFGKRFNKFTHIAVIASRIGEGINDVVIIDGVSNEFNKRPENYFYWKVI